MNIPQKFFGAEVRSIRTESDALKALDAFIRNASDEEIAAAVSELENINRQARSIIRSLLWKLEYELSSQEWMRCFELTYAAA